MNRTSLLRFLGSNLRILQRTPVTHLQIPMILSWKFRAYGVLTVLTTIRGLAQPIATLPMYAVWPQRVR